MNILLLAEACNPEWTSVPLVGFNMAQALSNRIDLNISLVTHVRNREALQRHPIRHSAEITYIDNEWIARPLHGLGKVLRDGGTLGWTTNMAVSWPAYIAFEKQVAHQFRDRLDQGEFDIIHRITPVSPTLPSALAALTDVPMLIGPLNGGLPWPSEYPALHKSEREWLSPVRGIYKYLPYYRASYRNLAAVISGSKHTASEVPKCFSGQHFYLPENGIDASRFRIADSWTAPGDDFQFISVGRLVPYKGFDLIIEAFAHSPTLRECRLKIIGEGPQRQTLEQRIEELGLANRITLTGWLPQAEVSRELLESQAFVFPSLREFGGGVVLEAMASGLPSIIVDYGGPAELITPECGIKVPLMPRPELISELKRTMESLATNHHQCRTMAHAAIELVCQRYTWDRKAETLVNWYRHIVQPQSISKGQAQSELVQVSGSKKLCIANH